MLDKFVSRVALSDFAKIACLMSSTRSFRECRDCRDCRDCFTALAERRACSLRGQIEHNVTTEPAGEARPDFSKLTWEQRQTLKELLLLAKGDGTIEE